MPIENWLVEEEIIPGPDLDIRAVVIRLLQKVIDALKESYIPGQRSDLPPTSFHDIHDELLSGPIFELPTVIFAYLDTQSTVEGDEDGEKSMALAQLICYRDRREFLRELATYGDEELIKEYGLRNFLRGTEPPMA